MGSRCQSFFGVAPCLQVSQRSWLSLTSGNFAGRKTPVLKSYVKTCEAVKRLGTDRGGVASYEYVIVAASVIAGVSYVFGGGPLQTALTNAITAIGTGLTGA